MLQLIKEAEQQLLADVTIKHDIFNLTEMLDEDGELVTESIQTFLAGAKALINRLVINTHNSAFDDKDRKLPGDENMNNTFETDDIILRFARILAGLEYFMEKGLDRSAKSTVNSILDDPHVTKYVKTMGKEKAQHLVDEILSCFHDGKLVNKQAIEKKLEDIKKFYLSHMPNKSDSLNP